MKKIISLILICFLISGCSFFRIHKVDIEQGNIITPDEVSQLRLGMSENEVKAILGTPVLSNIFTPNRFDYIYTLQKGQKNMAEKRIALIFYQGRLQEIQKSN